MNQAGLLVSIHKLAVLKVIRTQLVVKIRDKIGLLATREFVVYMAGAVADIYNTTT